MKKTIILVCTILACGCVAYGQYKPTQKDLGNDCMTENQKLGTWKEVTVRDDGSNSRTTNSSNTYGASVGGEYKAVNASVNGSANYSHSNGNSNTYSSGTSIEYKDIRCVEDKNANLPQQTPVRW